jgi:hypothetical protein
MHDFQLLRLNYAYCDKQESRKGVNSEHDVNQ